MAPVIPIVDSFWGSLLVASAASLLTGWLYCWLLDRLSRAASSGAFVLHSLILPALAIIFPLGLLLIDFFFGPVHLTEFKDFESWRRAVSIIVPIYAGISPIFVRYKRYKNNWKSLLTAASERSSR